MSKEMSAEYKAVSKQIKEILKSSTLSEIEKYSLISTCLTKVAHQYNGNDFSRIKLKLALVSKTMLNAVEAAEKLLGNLNK